MINVRDLSKAYPSHDGQHVVFSNFNLAIAAGERVGMFGSNGTGKTTLFSIIAGIETAFQGNIAVSAKRIGYMHQDVSGTLAPWFTAEQNILLARKYHGLNVEAGLRLLEKLIAELHLTFSLQKYPHDLSGGQRQLVSLVRSLVLEPDVLILDEPFASLDPQKRSDVLGVLDRRFPQTTLLIASHRGDEVQSLVSRAIVLDGQPTRIAKDIRASERGRRIFEQRMAEIHFPRDDE